MEKTSDNPQIERAREIVCFTNAHLFLTGKAGTGKTTFLRRLREELPKRMVVLAPTGIAAINARGVTIHSFFQLSFAPFVPGTSYAGQNNYKMSKQKIKLIQSLDLLVIDEISMVSADLLDAVDASLRRWRQSSQPFGGVQLLLIGDLQQLAPVVKDDEWQMLRQYYETPFFFSSHALQETSYVTVELTKVYRQQDEDFLSLLNSVREGRADKDVLNRLNTRYISNFRPAKEDGYVQLVTHNYQAQQINERKLSELSGTPMHFQAVVSGKFPEMSFPTDFSLTLKVGAQVMFVKNDLEKRYFNGMIGEVTGITEKGFSVRPNGLASSIEVAPEEWTNTRYGLDEKTKEIKEIVEGTFRQYPVKLAWAITIHKSQGLTFERVMINASGAFAHGQTYVALSRCKTLEGIVLTSPIPEKAIIIDRSVARYSESMRKGGIDESQVIRLRQKYGGDLLTDLFCFQKERQQMGGLVRIFQEFLYGLYPQHTHQYEAVQAEFDRNVMGVAARFHEQYQTLLQQSGGTLAAPLLQERIVKGAAYFTAKLYELRRIIGHTRLEVDNKEVSKRLQTGLRDMMQVLRTHIALLEFVENSGFSVNEFLNHRAKVLLGNDNIQKDDSALHAMETEKKEETYEVPTEIENPTLYYRIINWRKQKARELSIPVSSTVVTKAVIALANYAPTTMAELRRIPKLGKKSIANFGVELIEIIETYKRELADGTLEPYRPELKEAKVPSAQVSLGLFRQGRTITQIADERNLAQSTIFAHLASFIPTGEVKLYDLTTPEAFERVKAYFAQHPYDKERLPLSEIRAAIGEDISYGDLRAGMSALGYVKV